MIFINDNIIKQMYLFSTQLNIECGIIFKDLQNEINLHKMLNIV